VKSSKVISVLITCATLIGAISVPAIAAVDPCAATITKAGAAATSSDVETSSYGIYCVAKFKTVANDYTFTPPTGITKVDYLVVGGGGGGASGGGGAGGFLTANDFTVAPATPISITVGGGGAGGNGGSAQGGVSGGVGGNSVFASITAYGGGGGGSQAANTQNGASGGGSRSVSYTHLRAHETG
jgi:hypothetical protein